MGRNNQITKLAAILLSVFMMVVIIYAAVVSSIYVMHEHEHYEEEHCFICLELHVADSLTRQLTPAGSQDIRSVIFAVFVSACCICLICQLFERNLITDKVRMDR